jgi:antitoxin PrlF
MRGYYSSSKSLDVTMQTHYHGVVEVTMRTTLELESTLTDRYQTTVPDGVRRALKLGKRDKLRYVVQSDGKVLLARAPEAEDDQLLGKFLGFLAHDIEAHPEHLQGVDPGFVARVKALVRDVDIDLDAPLPTDDE